MEAETLNAAYRQHSFLQRSLPAIIPVLLISIGYVDPGKWVATVEGGTRFGYDLMVFMLIFNFAAIFCQYISARIGVITGRDLAQICSNEYDTWTCMLLGIQAELSVIMLDLNMIMGMAQGLNLIFGWDLFTCVFLTATGGVFHLLLAVLLDIEKAKILGQFVSGFIFLCFALEVLMNRPEIPMSMNGILTNLSGESAFVQMSLLGSALVPHNFYLHSSIVQWYPGPKNISKDALCHNHFWAILCIFSGLYLVNSLVMNTSANEYYSTGLFLLTLQDALSPMEQVIRSPITLFGFLLILFLANQTAALTWGFGGEVVVHGFLKLDIPGWLHYSTVRVIAVLPALYCVWSSGAEGMYQLLIFTQVLVALQLPSSVIPLFRVATSRSIMGVHKVSQFVELLALIIFIGMLGLNIVFVVEMLFGSSDWVGDLRWNVGNTVSFSYLFLLTTAFASLCLMLWLAATPLRSANIQLDAQTLNWDMPKAMPNHPVGVVESYPTATKYHVEASFQVKEPPSAPERTLEYSDQVSVASFHHDPPETIMEHDLHVTAVRKSHSIEAASGSPKSLSKETSYTSEFEAVSTVTDETSDSGIEDTTITIKMETCVPLEKEDEGDSNAERDEDDGDSWETEESSIVLSTNVPSSTSDGPPSLRSPSGKSDEGGNSVGSLSRLAGLGRSARRQLAVILEEFWGQLYDHHGKATKEAKVKKLDILLEGELASRLTSSFKKIDACGNEDYSDYLVSFGGRGSDNLLNSGPNDTSQQPKMQSNLDSSYGIQKSSSSAIQASNTQLLDAYVQNSGRNLLDSAERPYSSVRNFPSNEVCDYQPATIHGYQIRSYLSRVGKERNFDNLNSLRELSLLKSSSIGHTNYRDSVALALGKKLHNGFSVGQPPGFENVFASRNNQLQPERSHYNFRPSVPADYTVNSINAKKFHSLPSISGYSIPHRTAPDKNAVRDGSVEYQPSASRVSYEPSQLSNSGSRAGAPLAFDELSPSEAYRVALSSQLSSGFNTRSLWSKQPFEQFGVAGKIHNVALEGVENRPNTVSQETNTFVDIEGKLLLSLRLCILKLLKLEGSDWLFRQNDGIDEDLIDRVAAREKFVYEVEFRETNQLNHLCDAHNFASDRKSGPYSMKNNDANSSSFSVSSVPNCGDGCIWRSELIISFGVWCIHRILDLSIMESRPELWGKYTYVLNRLQGIIDLSFSKPRTPLSPCFCLQVPTSHQHNSSPPLCNGTMLPTATKSGSQKCTNSSMLLDLIKDVEMAISLRKGRAGTAACDVAFRTGKSNLASVLKRYRRRLSNKPADNHDVTGSRKISTSMPNNS